MATAGSTRPTSWPRGNPTAPAAGPTAFPKTAIRPTSTTLVGWNFVNNTNNPFDDHGHGTHTAGTIGAMGNNGIGVVGVNWNVMIMPLKFLDSSGSGSDLAASQAIRYAADHGARVSNNSWGGGSGGSHDFTTRSITPIRRATSSSPPLATAQSIPTPRPTIPRLITCPTSLPSLPSTPMAHWPRSRTTARPLSTSALQASTSTAPCRTTTMRS